MTNHPNRSKANRGDPVFQVWNTQTKEMMFEEVAPDLETAIKRAKNRVKSYDNIECDPDNVFVCLV